MDFVQDLEEGGADGFLFCGLTTTKWWKATRRRVAWWWCGRRRRHLLHHLVGATKDGGDVSDVEQHLDDGAPPDSELQVGGGGHRRGAVLGAEDIYFVPELELQGGSNVPDFEEQVGAGVPNGEQQLNNDLFADLDDQQMDDVEEPIDVEEMAVLGDDDDTVAGDEGIDEFAEIREDSKHGTTKMIIYYCYLLGFGHKVEIELEGSITLFFVLHIILLETMFFTALFIFL
uniref:Uncharacterized protein n=1 Tax=Oryza glumipatula TaxID=40148 RepID=A0A0D9ZWG0_9ORYZ